MENGIPVNSSNEEQGEEMPATERDLVENAAWKQIQKNTFTRWCNEQLKCVNKRIADLESDFSDGLRLISLLEVLSHKQMKKYNKRPNFRQMKLENVAVALNFMESEKIKLVSIGMLLFKKTIYMASLLYECFVGIRQKFSSFQKKHKVCCVFLNFGCLPTLESIY